MPEWKNTVGLKLTFIPATPARRAPGSNRIEASVRIFTISFVLLLSPDDQNIEGARNPVLSVTSRRQSSVDFRAQLGKSLGGPLGRDRVEFGVAQRGEELAVR